jgi:F-type H+-transporting ATPase subunit a
MGGMRGSSIIPSRWQSMVELTYEFVAGTMKDTVGNDGKPYFPFVFTLFMFVLMANLLGMVPYSFTPTSHIIVTFALAMVVFVGTTLVGFAKHGLHFFSFFAPKGVPWPLLILIVPIELFAYLMRPVSLSIRLAANMTAGHILLKVLAGFVSGIGILGILPLAGTVLITGFEIGIAFLQAYIFTILTCIYLNDAIHLH